MNFKIDRLDHVAIRVADMEQSINWYSNVLGLKSTRLKKWGDYPVFMLADSSGIALFPAKLDDEPLNSRSKNVKIDHFAFLVSNDNFKRAEEKYKVMGLAYEFQDHHYFHSIYTKDPDGHTVELTTQILSI